ncbi:MAG: M20/M25/M40 family metallo-hydrolase, partial [Gemmatimonadota bacterium]
PISLTMVTLPPAALRLSSRCSSGSMPAAPPAPASVGSLTIGEGMRIAVPDTVELANGRLAARSIDDRIGALVALEALRRAGEKAASAHVVAVATTQEEIGYKSGGGAGSGTFGLEPDAAVVIDVTHATDHPSVDSKEHGAVKLGEGPVLSRGAVINRVLYERLVSVAEEAGIPFQVEAAPSTTGTDADAIYTSRAGVATAVVSVPNRYMHSPNQTVAASDVEHAVELIALLLASLTDRDSFLPV